MPSPLDPTERITLAMVHTAAESLDAATLAAATKRSALSDLEHALIAQVRAHLSLTSDGDAYDRLNPPAYCCTHLPVDITPFLTGSREAALTRAKRLGHERPDNAARRVARLLEILAPWAISTQHRSDVTAPTLTEFHTIADLISVTAPVATCHPHSSQAVRHALRRIGKTAAANGVVTVDALPTDFDAMMTLLADWGLAAKARHQTLWALRSARRMLVAVSGAPVLPEWQRRHRGAMQRDVITERMPLLAQDLADWDDIAPMKIGERQPGNRSRTAHTDLSPMSRYAYRASIRQWAMALLTLVDRNLIELTTPLRDVDFETLWLVTAPASRRRALPAHVQASVSARLARKGVLTPVEATRQVRPLALAVIDLALDNALFEKTSRDSEGRWPKSSAQMAFRLWSATERVALSSYGEGSEQIASLRSVWVTVMPTLKDVLMQPNTVKDLPRMLKMITLPQVVCLLLPWWTLVELPRLEMEAAHTLRLAQRANASMASEARARVAQDAFIVGLDEYRALATFTADPWRIRNMMHARLGKEIHIDAAWTNSGDIATLRAVGSSFPRRVVAEIAEVAPKTGEARLHWNWSPSIIDLEWFAKALRLSWLPALVAAGHANEGTTLRDAIMSGRYAWFVNRDRRTESTGVVEGAYRSADGVAVRFGDALLRGLRALGRTDLPSSAEAASTEGFPYLFRPHAVRTWWATYWYHIRGDAGPSRRRPDGSMQTVTGRAVATRATGDVDATLESSYVSVEDTLDELGRSPLTSFEHPNAFDFLMDRTWWHESRTDWRAIWRDSGVAIPPHLRALTQKHRAA